METLSIIVPVYNRKEFLDQCINSILDQDYKNIELILVDDGSTDGSGQICDSFESKDERVRVIHQENMGCISARLHGIQESRGKYIGFVDSDDWVARDMYTLLMTAVEEKKCDIVSMGYIMVCGEEESKEDDGTLFGDYVRGKNLDVLLSNMMYDEKEKRRGVHPALWSKVFKKDILLKAYATIDKTITMGEDAAIFYPCCLNANSIYIMKEYKYYYRIHSESMCWTMDITTISEIYSFYQYMKKILLKNGEIYAFSMQLRKYLWTFIAAWLEQVFDVKLGGDTFIFPYTMIDRNSNIVLYGAGRVGQAYYQQIQENHYCNIVAWADKNKNGNIIIHPRQILGLKYCKIVIAIMEEKVANEVIDELVVLGIEREKILWIKPQRMLQDVL